MQTIFLEFPKLILNRYINLLIITFANSDTMFIQVCYLKKFKIHLFLLLRNNIYVYRQKILYFLNIPFTFKDVYEFPIKLVKK